MFDEELPQALQDEYSRFQSWRYMAEERYQGIHFATLYRYAYGARVYDQEHREILGLPLYEVVMVCPTHGVIHGYDCETEAVYNTETHTVRKTRPPGSGERSTRAARVEIALSDPVKARARLEKKLAEYHGKEV